MIIKGEVRVSNKFIKLDDYRKNDNKFEKMTIDEDNEFNVGLYGDDYCVVCGAYVPEGSQVCPACLKKYELNKR